MFDEYMGTREHAYFRGAQSAIDEFLGERRSRMQRDPGTGKYYFVMDRQTGNVENERDHGKSGCGGARPLERQACRPPTGPA
jgi:hypothetical protein